MIIMPWPRQDAKPKSWSNRLRDEKERRGSRSSYGTSSKKEDVIGREYSKVTKHGLAELVPVYITVPKVLTTFNVEPLDMVNRRFDLLEKSV